MRLVATSLGLIVACSSFGSAPTKKKPLLNLNRLEAAAERIGGSDDIVDAGDLVHAFETSFQMSKKEMEEVSFTEETMEQVLALCDGNGDGQVTSAELAAEIRAVATDQDREIVISEVCAERIAGTAAECESDLAEIDLNKDGTLQMTEMVDPIFEENPTEDVDDDILEEQYRGLVKSDELFGVARAGNPGNAALEEVPEFQPEMMEAMKELAMSLYPNNSKIRKCYTASIHLPVPVSVLGNKETGAWTTRDREWWDESGMSSIFNGFTWTSSAGGGVLLVAKISTYVLTKLATGAWEASVTALQVGELYTTAASLYINSKAYLAIINSKAMKAAVLVGKAALVIGVAAMAVIGVWALVTWLSGKYEPFPCVATGMLEDVNVGIGASSPWSDWAAVFDESFNGGRVTKKGCACRKNWRMSDEDVKDFCGNPDNDAGGEWCFVIDRKCEKKSWGYCARKEPAHEGGCASGCKKANVATKDSSSSELACPVRIAYPSIVEIAAAGFEARPDHMNRGMKELYNCCRGREGWSKSISYDKCRRQKQKCLGDLIKNRHKGLTEQEKKPARRFCPTPEQIIQLEVKGVFHKMQRKCGAHTTRYYCQPFQNSKERDEKMLEAWESLGGSSDNVFSDFRKQVLGRFPTHGHLYCNTGVEAPHFVKANIYKCPRCDHLAMTDINVRSLYWSVQGANRESCVAEKGGCLLKCPSFAKFNSAWGGNEHSEWIAGVCVRPLVVYSPKVGAPVDECSVPPP